MTEAETELVTYELTCSVGEACVAARTEETTTAGVVRGAEACCIVVSAKSCSGSIS
jgi:hypothetical protein